VVYPRRPRGAMSRNFDEMVPDEAERQRSRFRPVEAPAPARPVWNWEELNAKFRPRLIAAGVIRFGLTQDECEDAAQTVFLKVLAMNPRVRDPKAYLRAAFLNQCNNIMQARERRGVGDFDHGDSGRWDSDPAIEMRQLGLADSGAIEIPFETATAAVPASQATAPMRAEPRTLWDRIRAGLGLRP
jgi:DNA-directed RNA polymerase specialized sigma24 family protein